MHPHGYKLNGAINTLFFWFITEKKRVGEKKKKDPQIKQNREKSYIERSKSDLQYQEVIQTRTTCQKEAIKGTKKSEKN